MWKSHLCSLQPQVLLEQPPECGLEEGLLGLIYALVTAEALDTALCFTRHWCLHGGLASPLCFWGEKSLFSLESAEKRGSRDAATVLLFILSGHKLWISAIHPLSSLLSRGWSWGLIGTWSCTSSASHQGCLRAKFLCTVMGRINVSTSLSGPSANLLGQLVVCN